MNTTINRAASLALRALPQAQFRVSELPDIAAIDNQGVVHQLRIAPMQPMQKPQAISLADRLPKFDRAALRAQTITQQTTLQLPAMTQLQPMQLAAAPSMDITIPQAQLPQITQLQPMQLSAASPVVAAPEIQPMPMTRMQVERALLSFGQPSALVQKIGEALKSPIAVMRPLVVDVKMDQKTGKLQRPQGLQQLISRPELQSLRTVAPQTHVYIPIIERLPNSYVFRALVARKADLMQSAFRIDLDDIAGDHAINNNNVFLWEFRIDLDSKGIPSININREVLSHSLQQQHIGSLAHGQFVKFLRQFDGVKIQGFFIGHSKAYNVNRSRQNYALELFKASFPNAVPTAVVQAVDSQGLPSVLWTATINSPLTQQNAMTMDSADIAMPQAAPLARVSSPLAQQNTVAIPEIAQMDMPDMTIPQLSAIASPVALTIPQLQRMPALQASSPISPAELEYTLQSSDYLFNRPDNSFVQTIRPLLKENGFRDLHVVRAPVVQNVADVLDLPKSRLSSTSPMPLLADRQLGNLRREIGALNPETPVMVSVITPKISRIDASISGYSHTVVIAKQKAILGRGFGANIADVASGNGDKLFHWKIDFDFNTAGLPDITISRQALYQPLQRQGLTSVAYPEFVRYLSRHFNGAKVGGDFMSIGALTPFKRHFEDPYMTTRVSTKPDLAGAKPGTQWFARVPMQQPASSLLQSAIQELRPLHMQSFAIPKSPAMSSPMRSAMQELAPLDLEAVQLDTLSAPSLRAPLFAHAPALEAVPTTLSQNTALWVGFSKAPADFARKAEVQWNQLQALSANYAPVALRMNGVTLQKLTPRANELRFELRDIATAQPIANIYMTPYMDGVAIQQISAQRPGAGQELVHRILEQGHVSKLYLTGSNNSISRDLWSMAVRMNAQPDFSVKPTRFITMGNSLGQGRSSLALGQFDTNTVLPIPTIELAVAPRISVVAPEQFKLMKIAEYRPSEVTLKPADMVMPQPIAKINVSAPAASLRISEIEITPLSAAPEMSSPVRAPPLLTSNIQAPAPIARFEAQNFAIQTPTTRIEPISSPLTTSNLRIEIPKFIPAVAATTPRLARISSHLTLPASSAASPIVEQKLRLPVAIQAPQLEIADRLLMPSLPRVESLSVDMMPIEGTRQPERLMQLMSPKFIPMQTPHGYLERRDVARAVLIEQGSHFLQIEDVFVPEVFRANGYGGRLYVEGAQRAALEGRFLVSNQYPFRSLQASDVVDRLV
ncbi:MAG: hypothetical protein WC426_14280, partial [Sulfuriferula sp.]